MRLIALSFIWKMCDSLRGLLRVEPSKRTLISEVVEAVNLLASVLEGSITPAAGGDRALRRPPPGLY